MGWLNFEMEDYEPLIMWKIGRVLPYTLFLVFPELSHLLVVIAPSPFYQRSPVFAVLLGTQK